MAVVNLRNGESQDQLLKRFRKKVVKSGVLSTERRMEKKKAARRFKRKQFTRDTDR